MTPTATLQGEDRQSIAEPSAKTSKRVLDPIERISEVWFGLIMVLTFTCSLSVKEAGRTEVRQMLFAALGCNVAWGILDAFMYLLSSYVERGRGLSLLRAVRRAPSAEGAHSVISDALPPFVAAALPTAAFEAVREKINRLPEIPSRPGLTTSDWRGAAGIFLLVLLSTFPPTIPFALINNARSALRVSNGIALVMLFFSGYAFGRYADYRPWRAGVWMVLIGAGLVAATIALGG